MPRVILLAEEIASQWKSGDIKAIKAEDRLLDLGFHSITFTRNTIRAFYLNVEYTL